MKSIFLSTLFVIIIGGCVSKPDTLAASHPTYVSPSESLSPSSQPPVHSDEGTAAGEAVYFLASGLASLARKSSTQGNLITGLVICQKSPSETLQLPCGPIKIILKDQVGKAITSGRMSGGEFAFQVPPNAKYRIETESKTFHQSDDQRLLVAGNDQVLHLYRKAK